MIRSLLLVGSLTLLACGGSSSQDSDLRIEANNGQCVISTGKSAGAACAGPSECAMVCCSCSGGSKHYSASACLGGSCASMAAACDLAVNRGEALCN